MYLGRYQPGQTVPLTAVSRNAVGTLSVPDDCPEATVFAPDGSKVSVQLMPVVDRYAQTGLFILPLRLSSLYAGLGTYQVVYRWSIGGQPGMAQASFDVVEGGSPDGAVISIAYYPRPWASFLVQQLDSGQLVFGRNPRL